MTPMRKTPQLLRSTVLPALLVAGLLSTAHSQVVVEETVRTDSVDVFSAGRQTGKSPGLAMAASVAVPGLGQQYLGNRNRAMVYFVAEAALWCGLVYCESSSRKLFRDSEVFAGQWAGVQGGRGADDHYWSMVGKFLDTKDYNAALELNREDDLSGKEFSRDNLQWRWTTDSLRNVYNNIRSDATRFHVATSFMVAGLVLNRAIAFIDARVSTKYRGVRGTHAAVTIGPRQASLSLVRQF